MFGSQNCRRDSRCLVLAIGAMLIIAVTQWRAVAAAESEDQIPLHIYERAYTGDPAMQADLALKLWQLNGDAGTRVESLDWYRRYLENPKRGDIARRHVFPLCCLQLTIGTPMEQQTAAQVLLDLATRDMAGAKIEVAKAYRYGLGFSADTMMADQWAGKVAHDILATLPPSARERGDALWQIREDAERVFRASFSEDTNCLPPDLETAHRAHEFIAKIVGESGVDFRPLQPASR